VLGDEAWRGRAASAAGSTWAAPSWGTAPGCACSGAPSRATNRTPLAAVRRWRRIPTPRPPLLGAAGLDPAAGGARGVRERAVAPPGRPVRLAVRRGQAVELTTVYAATTLEQAPRSLVPGTSPAAVDASELLATAGATTRLAERLKLEVRAGFGQSVREYGAWPAPATWTRGPR
jgi:hypothetical protein